MRISDTFQLLPNIANFSSILVEPSVWAVAGAGGSALQARYSEYHVVRTVLQGTCRIILFPPTATRNMYLFPSIHSANKQSQVICYIFVANMFILFIIRVLQVDFYLESSKDIFPLYLRSEVSEVVLHAGQYLYIPPYWFVHMEEISDGYSVGIDVSSPSVSQTLLLEAFMTALPIRGENLDLRHKNTKVIVSMVRNLHFHSTRHWLAQYCCIY